MPKTQPVGFVRLAKAISWAGAVPGTRYREFHRGTIYPMYTEHEYNWLIKNGICQDPYKTLNHINPEDLKFLGPGTEVVIIRDIGIGDILIISTLLNPLKQAYPRVRFSFATNSNHLPIFDNAACINRGYQISKMRGSFTVMDMRGFAERHYDKHRLERIDIYARYFLGRSLGEYTFPIPVLAADETVEAESILSAVDRPIALMVAKSATTHTRTIPKQQIWSMSRYLMKQGISVVLIHNDHLPDWPCSLNLTGQLNIRQLSAITAAADVVVTPDTGLVHIAEAVHTPHVDLFSAWPPSLRLTYYQYCYPIWKGDEVACCPCYNANGPCSHLTCFALMTNEEIYTKIKEALGSPTEAFARRSPDGLSKDDPMRAI